MDLEDALDALAPLGDVHARPMFGGHGLYHGAVFFAIYMHGRLYFHTDDASRAAYTEREMEPFVPRPGIGPFRYYEIPGDVLADPPTLAEWARRAIDSRPADTGRSATRRRGAVRSARSSGVAPSPSRPG
jgi:DNA transformation protein and related proteins